MNGSWQTIEISGKRADVYSPPGGVRPRFGVLYLHHIAPETLVGRTAFTKHFDDHRIACVCPRAGICWWADRICPEFDPKCTPHRHLLDNVLPYFASTWNLRPPAIGLLGIGMGGQGGLRLAFGQPQTFPIVAALSSAIEYHDWYGQGTSLDDMYDSKEQCRQDTVPMHVHPSHHPSHLYFAIDPADPWVRGNDRLHEKLKALGVEHEYDRRSAGGHSWTYFDAMAERAISFVNAGLEEMSRRLL